LTLKRIARLKRQKGRHRDGGDGAVKGLYLNVRGPNNVSWLLRYQVGTKETWLGLGPLSLVDLVEARKRAREARLKLLDGLDPLAERQKEKAAKKLAALKVLTFKEAAESYIAANRDSWTNLKHYEQWNHSLRDYVFPILGALPVGAIDTGLVLRVMEQRIEPALGLPGGTLWTARRETASRVRGRIESILDWAGVRGYRQGDNPARWKGHLQHALGDKAKVQANHHAALPYAELPAFMTALRALEGSAARALQFAILTAARSAEVFGAKWDEIDLDAAIWTIPPGRMKGGREHKVPLALEAVALLKTLPREDEIVFVGSQPGAGLNSHAMVRVLRRLARNDLTVHGFRSSFRDWSAERTNFPREVAEQALAHTIGSAVERAYRRTDLFKKRAALMAAWAKYCTTPPITTGEANVVPIGRNA
jgi:integrase